MTAASAEPIEFEPVGRNSEAIPIGYFLLKLFDFAVFKFHDFAAVGANQMVMMALMGNIVVLRLGAEMPGLCQAGFTEKIEGAVDRRESEVRIFLRQLVIHFFGRDVFLLQERVEDELTLAGVLQLVFAEVCLQQLHLFYMFGHSVRPDLPRVKAIKDQRQDWVKGVVFERWSRGGCLTTIESRGYSSSIDETGAMG